MTTTKELTGTPARTGNRWLTFYTASLLLIVIGLFISGYLSYVTLTNTEMACVAGDTFNCSAVQNSIYAKMFGIPIAVLGLATYILLGVLHIFENRIGFLRDYGLEIIFGLTLFAWLYSMWLVYLQLFRIEALCSWCLAHELNITILFVFVSIRLWRKLTSDDQLDQAEA